VVTTVAVSVVLVAGSGHGCFGWSWLHLGLISGLNQDSGQLFETLSSVGHASELLSLQLIHLFLINLPIRGLSASFASALPPPPPFMFLAAYYGEHILRAKVPASVTCTRYFFVQKQLQIP
jgi:hypothetical protein